MKNMVLVDFTVAIQLVNFLVAMIVINYLLIRPVRKQLAERRQFTETQAGDINAFTDEANAKLADYEAALAQARSKASSTREELKVEGHVQEQNILTAAQSEAQVFLRNSRDKIRQESETAMADLSGRVKTYATLAAAKILG
jgi:F-type H+-transporting ATPase subunit b